MGSTTLTVTADDLSPTSPSIITDDQARNIAFTGVALKSANPYFDVCKEFFQLPPVTSAKSLNFLLEEEWLHGVKCRGCDKSLLEGCVLQNWDNHRGVCAGIERKMVLAILRDFDAIRRTAGEDGRMVYYHHLSTEQAKLGTFMKLKRNTSLKLLQRRESVLGRLKKQGTQEDANGGTV